MQMVLFVIGAAAGLIQIARRWNELLQSSDYQELKGFAWVLGVQFPIAGISATCKTITQTGVSIILSGGGRGTNEQLWGLSGNAQNLSARAFGAAGCLVKLPNTITYLQTSRPSDSAAAECARARPGE